MESRPKNYPKLKDYKPSRFMLPTCHYDKAKADRAVRFIENHRHTKGKWAGKRFWLLPWQEQIIRDVFGIVDERGNRQFRTAYVEIGKKNGKSELAAAVALYLLFADNEPSAEVYGAAADRQQASIVFDVANQIYHAYTDEVPGEQNKDIYFRRDEIFHVPGLGFNGLIGFSPIAMMKNSLGTSIAVDKYGSAFFKNGAQPSGVLEHPGVMKDPNRVRDNWEAAYGGAANAHRVAVLEEGMTYKPVSLPPEDSQFLESKQFSVTEICRIFRVPPHMIGDLDRATFSNIESQNISFAVHTIRPWLVRIEQAINRALFPDNEKGRFYVQFNLDGLMRGDYKSRMEGYAIARQNGWMSTNDIRELENLNPVSEEEGGNAYLVNGNMIPISLAGLGVLMGLAIQGNQESSQDTGQDNGQDAPEEETKPEENEPPKRGRREAR